MEGPLGSTWTVEQTATISRRHGGSELRTSISPAVSPLNPESRWVGGTEPDVGRAKSCGVGGLVIGLLL